MGYLQAMRDKCKIMTAGSPASGEPIPAYSLGSEIRCQFSRVRQSSGGEVEGGAGNYQPMLRIPRGTTVTSLDRVRITKIGRSTGLTKDFAIDGEPVDPQDGNECIVLKLKRIHEASV